MCMKLFHVPTERNQHNRVYQIISCFSNCNSLMRTVLLLTSHIHWQQLYSFLIHVSWIFHLSHPLNQLWSGYNHYFCDTFDVNGNQTNLDTSWPENEEAVQLFLSAYFIILSFQYLYKRSTFLLWIWTLPGTTMLVYSPYQQEQKKAGLLRYLILLLHTVHPCVWCHWHRLLGTKWQHSWSSFQNLQMLGNWVKNCGAQLFQSIPMDRAH